MKIKSVKKIISIILAVCLMATVFSACSNREKKINFVYPFNADVVSFDPQVASTSDEFLIIENTFEGLIRIDDNGKVRPACAEKWSVSDDGLTYTFHLKKGLKWNIKTDKYEEGEKKGEFKDERLRMLGREFNPEITADDFVFALQRAVLPETKAPLFPSIAAIKNAVAINNGKMKAETLGVTATDKYTLSITLTSPDSAFMQALSSSVAMPCNKEFFKATKGRYGLETKYTLFNGQFYLSSILESSYLLKMNEEYKGPSPTVISQLSLQITNEEDEVEGSKKSTVSRLENGYFDAAFITGEQSSKIDEKSGITYVPYNDTTWALLLNTNAPAFESKTMRQAFCTGLSRLEKYDKKYIKNATCLTPPSCVSGGASVINQIGQTVPDTDEMKSINLWNKGLKITKTTEISATILTVPEMSNELKAMLQGVQSGIGSVVKNDDGEPVEFTLKVEEHTIDEINNKLATGEYDAVLYPFKSSSNSAITFLKSFSENNKTGFKSAKFDAALTNAEKSSNVSDEIKYIRLAEDEIIKTYSIYPMVYETSYYACAKGVSNIDFHSGTGRVSFVNATREED